jgi:hypothetical protein
VTPTISEYQPIPAQLQLHRLLRSKEYKYKGIFEVLLSGSVGSAKSLGMAHELIVQAVSCKNANIGIFRKDMPALKDTILKTTLDHMGTDLSYAYNKTRSQITLANSSSMTALSWGDGQIKKFRSYEFDVSGIEELTENPTIDFYTELYQRHGRRKWFKRPVIISATNPDSPAHWAYKHFIDTDNPNRIVLYSRTIDNPHLSPEYIEGLKRNLTHAEVRRQIYGEWIEISKEVIYYAYKREVNFIDKEYILNPALPYDITFDFNIGIGKPMSSVLAQYDGKYHIAKDFILSGGNTPEMCEELIDYLKDKQFSKIRMYGDASGKNRDTRNTKSDWDIILHSFKNAFPKVQIEYCVPIANPPIRKRHNLLNAKFCNAFDQHDCFVYNQAKTVDEGFRLTSLKKGGQLIEDDSKPYQHCTTAVGYYIVFNEAKLEKRTKEY